jgi:hypothetical protein
MRKQLTLRQDPLGTVVGWKQHADLTYQQLMQVEAMVGVDTALNNVFVVDMLVEAVRFHGEMLDEWWLALLERYEIEEILFALEVLRELGERGEAEGTQARPQSFAKPELEERFDLDDMLEFIKALAEIGREYDSHEHLCRVIDNQLGGWELAKLLDANQLAGLLRGELDVDELRELIFGDEDAAIMAEAAAMVAAAGMHDAEEVDEDDEIG